MAHAKGSKYEKTLSKVFGTVRGAAAGEQLLQQCLAILEDFAAFARRPAPPSS